MSEVNEARQKIEDEVSRRHLTYVANAFALDLMLPEDTPSDQMEMIYEMVESGIQLGRAQGMKMAADVFEKRINEGFNL